VENPYAVLKRYHQLDALLQALDALLGRVMPRKSGVIPWGARECPSPFLFPQRVMACAELLRSPTSALALTGNPVYNLYYAGRQKTTCTAKTERTNPRRFSV